MTHNYIDKESLANKPVIHPRYPDLVFITENQHVVGAL